MADEVVKVGSQASVKGGESGLVLCALDRKLDQTMAAEYTKICQLLRRRGLFQPSPVWDRVVGEQRFNEIVRLSRQRSRDRLEAGKLPERFRLVKPLQRLGKRYSVYPAAAFRSPRDDVQQVPKHNTR